MAPNRLQAYREARAAAGPQKGLTYSELLLDNIIGLDNDYLSAGEQLGQAFNADEIGFLKNAGISAYEGAKEVIADPIGAGEELLFGIYDSVENLATEDLDARLKRMYGVGYDQASEDQVTSARESVFGDAVTASGLIPGAALAGTGVKGLASLPFRGERRARERLSELEAFQQEAALNARRDAEADLIDVEDIDWDDYYAAQDRMLARQTPIRELQLREAEGGDLTAAERDRLEAAGLPDGLDRLPSLLERVQRGDVLTDEEAFDVMTFERFGEDGVYDPTNTFERWGQQQNADAEGAARIAFLTGANTDVGQTPVTPVYGPYFQDNPAFQVPDLPGEAPFLAVEDMMDFHPDDINFDAPQYNAMGLMPDEADEYGALEDDLLGFGLTEMEAEDARAQLDELRETGRRRIAANRPFEVRPAVGQAEGIAGLYSPTRKAVDLLDRPSYDNLDSLKTQLANRGAKPDEIERLMAKIPGTQNNPMSEEQLESFLSDPRSGQFSKEDIARLADEASQDVVVSTRTLMNSPRDANYYLNDRYFLQGAEDIGANVFEAPSDNAPTVAFNHFKASSGGTAPILHTRFGMFRSPGAAQPDTYHLGELQSDWAQMRQKLLPTRADFEAAKERYLEADNRLMELIAQSRKMKADWQQKHGALSSMGGDPRFSNTPNIFEDAEFQSVEKAREKAQEEVGALEGKVNSTNQYGTRDEFDAKHPAPYVGTTSKWVQLGLRQSLLDAANKGAKRMTLSTGEMVQSYTGGKLEGQQKFYDDTVIKELDTVLKRFAKEAGIRKPEITTSKIVGDMFQEYVVPTVEFTDEFVEALKRVGLPAYAKGGIVKGSYLDNDPFEPALY
jgi:hypothetical protein